MSSRLATWLRVTPSVTTLAESSAIHQALQKQGRVSVFARCKNSGHEQMNDTRDGSSSTFYAVFPHGVPTLQTTFDVPVYHDLPSARDQDPFNIRGLQNRKPMPAPKTFSCTIERTRHNQDDSEEDPISKENPYHGHFAVEKHGCIERVLVMMKAPPGLARGCGVGTKGAVGAVPHGPSENDGTVPWGKARRINMGSVMEMWREATGATKDKGVPAHRILLDVDKPLGKS